MTLKLHNTLTKRIDTFKPLVEKEARIYSCGPTVYDHAHIGNLSAFISADILRRIASADYSVTHVMNFTDIDDKTIKRSQTEYPELEPLEALRTSTRAYTEVFLDDMLAIGNDIDAITFIRATDDKSIDGMKTLIANLHKGGYAYIAEDGVYFSIETYQKSGKTYGQLVEITASNTSSARIQNDEYDKDSVHDFALWKTEKPGEPAWDFALDDQNLRGRPGWHIECSVMSRQGLGQPFDIHTGGIDLAFPHHENEIAQSTAGEDNPTYATYFVHNEHVLVDGRKMSKSLGNFYTLKDLTEKGIDPLAFRMLVLQSHYRKQTNFSFENIEAAANRLQSWRNYAALRHQTHDRLIDDTLKNDDSEYLSLLATMGAIGEALKDDLNTPRAMTIVDEAFSRMDSFKLEDIHRYNIVALVETIDELLGLQLAKSTPDIDQNAKQLILERERARESKDWKLSDEIRDKLQAQGIALRDTSSGAVWSYSS